MNKKNILLILLSLILLSTMLIILALRSIDWHVQTQQSKQALVLYGNVDIRDVSLSFRVPGRLQTLYFEEGDHVKKGTLLAQLDNDTYAADLELTKASLAEAIAIEKNSELTYQRRAKLIQSGAVEKSLYDDAIAQKDEAAARVWAAKIQVDKAKIALSDTQILTPTDGTILTRVREPGSIVTQTQAVYTLAIDSPLWIRTYISEPDLGFIYPGQPALVYTDSRPDKPYVGHIGFISPQAEFTPKTVQTAELRTALVYRFRVIVDHPDNGLRQGMPVTVKIELRQPVHHD